MKLAIGIVLAAIAVASMSAGDPATLSSKTPVEEATKTTEATKSSKSTKTSETSGSGIGSLFDDASGGVIGDESGADAKTVDPKFLTSIGITVPMSEAGSKFDLGLGPGPAVYPSDSGSWDWSWDSVEGSGSHHYDCDTVCPGDYEPVCGSDNVTYKNECAFTVAQCNATDLAVASSGECALASSKASTAGSSTGESCPDACTMEYSPVVDENGKEYSNECAMRLAKCKGETGEKKKIVDFTALDKPSLVKGVKETEAPSTATKSSKSTKASKSEKTGTASGSGIGSLFEDGSDGIIGESESGSADPTLVKGVKETEAPSTATKSTKASKSEKTGTASGSGIGSLFEDGSDGIIGESESGSADPTLVKGVKETEAPSTATKSSKSTKASKSEKTGTASGSGIGSLFEDGSDGIIGESESGSADPTLVKGVK
ncbi:Kazal-like serine protease inhibitor domain-containing protein, partial [Phytophthora sojae]